MSTEIARSMQGRALYGNALASELRKRHGLTLRETQEAIAGALDQIIAIDGRDNVILNRRATRPHLLENNPNALDIDTWVEISDQTADEIREYFTAVYGEPVEESDETETDD